MCTRKILKEFFEQTEIELSNPLLDLLLMSLIDRKHRTAVNNLLRKVMFFHIKD